MCVEIISNNSLVGGHAQGWGLNPGHWAHHTLLHVVCECYDDWATRKVLALRSQKIPGYENHQFCQADAAAVSRWPSSQCPTQRRDCGHTMIWDSGCILHSHSPSTSGYAAAAAPGTHQSSRTPALQSHDTIDVRSVNNKPLYEKFLWRQRLLFDFRRSFFGRFY